MFNIAQVQGIFFLATGWSDCYSFRGWRRGSAAMDDDLAKRRETYLERAKEAERSAKAASGKTIQDSLLKIADSWRVLAEQVGRQFKG